MNSLITVVGWSLVMFLWQGAIIGVIAALALRVARRADARVRYAIACMGLFVLLIAPCLTGWSLRSQLKVSATVESAIPPPTTPTGSVAFSQSPSTTASADRTLAGGVPAAGWLTVPEDQLPAIVAAWLIGVFLLLARLGHGWWHVRRLHRMALATPASSWQTACARLARRLGIHRAIHVAECAVVEVPAVVGWIRPVVLLPLAALANLSPLQVEAILAHELAHIRRHDYLVNLAQTVAETLLFYQPAVWWMSRQIRLEREHCCDDVAVELCGDRVIYAHALSTLEESRSGHPSYGLAAAGGPLLSRIRRVLGLPHERRVMPVWVVAGIAMSVIALPLVATDMEDPSTRTAATVPGAAQGSSTQGSRIQGRVLDAHSGRPLAGVLVGISQSDKYATATTDASGRYQVRGLAPGEYHVNAQAENYAPTVYGQRFPSEAGTPVLVAGNGTISGIDLRLQPAASISGRIFADSGEGLSGVEIEVLAERYVPGFVRRRVPVAFAQTEALGAFRVPQLPPGHYYVRAYTRSRPSKAGGDEIYAPTYFPQTPNIDEAQVITLGSGQEVLGVDFALATVRTFHVQGRVIDPNAVSRDMNQARVIIEPRSPAPTLQQTVPVDADGRFRISDVIPGDYVLRVQQRWPQAGRWLAITQPVSVDGHISDVTLVARQAARLEGHIISEGSGPLPFDPKIVRVGIGVVNLPGVMFIGAGPSTVQSDGTFTIENVAGPIGLHVLELPQGWTVKAIRVDGRDVTDQMTDFGAGVQRGITIALTDRQTELIGRVADRAGRVVQNYTVIVFSQDRTGWQWPSRFVRSVRSRSDGAYRIQGLPPAEYLAIAVESVPRDAWADPEMLDRLWSLARPFHLDEGEQRAVNLRLASMPVELQVSN